MAKKKSHPPEAQPLAGETAVLVCTEFRGVFFGYTKDVMAEPIALRRARNCVSWPESQHGFVGLATKGPLEGAKIGPAADMPRIAKVTCVVLCTPEAIAGWEDERW